MSKAEKFAVIIGALCATFNRTATPATITAYEWGLGGLSLESIERAAKQSMRTSKFMPTPAELRELAGEIPPQSRALMAWKAFKKGLLDHDYYHSVNFDDPIINATIRNLGGWMKVSEEWSERPAHEFDTWFRKEFERVYISLFASGIRADEAAHLPGFFEMQNGAKNLEHDSQKVKQIETGLPPLPAGVLRIDGEKIKLLESVKGIS